PQPWGNTREEDTGLLERDPFGPGEELPYARGAFGEQTRDHPDRYLTCRASGALAPLAGLFRA
ncbi:hypothetical protein, partial [Streptomyces albidoflavus]|uniref:hypothetical protein n=1 Tax=Streptomyces albidoflavus TaxID=1886 RepID=UPI0035277919